MTRNFAMSGTATHGNGGGGQCRQPSRFPTLRRLARYCFYAVACATLALGALWFASGIRILH